MYGGGFVVAKVVQYDKAVRGQGRGEDLPNTGSEYFAVDPSPWSLGPVAFPWLGVDDCTQPAGGRTVRAFVALVIILLSLAVLEYARLGVDIRRFDVGHDPLAIGQFQSRGAPSLRQICRS